jgi:hypothetical protein
MPELPAFPKPGQIKKKPEAVKVFPNGREICNIKCKTGLDEYLRRKRIMWERQNKKCGLQIAPQCKERQGRLLIDECTFDHDNGRGGGKQDDRIEKPNPETGKMEPVNHAVCWWCNSLKGSRPLSDFDSYNVP